MKVGKTGGAKSEVDAMTGSHLPNSVAPAPPRPVPLRSVPSSPVQSLRSSFFSVCSVVLWSVCSAR